MHNIEIFDFSYDGIAEFGTFSNLNFDIFYILVGFPLF